MTFLHFAKPPDTITVLQNPSGNVIYIDKNGWTWEGPTIDENEDCTVGDVSPQYRDNGSMCTLKIGRYARDTSRAFSDI